MVARFAAGGSAIKPLPDDVKGYGAFVGDIPLATVPDEIRSRLGRLDRFCRLLLSASFAAVRSARLIIDPLAAHRIGLSVGTGLGCLLTDAEYNQKLVENGPPAASPRLFAYTVSSAAAGELSIALGIKGPNVTAHQGIAAGLGAVGYACDLIRMGKADVILAAGVDALGPALVQGLSSIGLLKPTPGAVPFQDQVPGIYPSEGAAVLVLESAAHAQRRQARPLAVVRGYAAGFEPSLPTPQRRPTALVASLRQALTRSATTPAEVGVVLDSAHATALDPIERAAFDEVLGPASSVPRLSPKQAWGECFAAHGVLATALAAGRMASGDRARIAVVHALCYSGPTVALVIAREE